VEGLRERSRKGERHPRYRVESTGGESKSEREGEKSLLFNERVRWERPGTHTMRARKN